MTLVDLKLQPHKLHFQISGLLALAVFVWLRDLTWVARASDTIPVLAALPVLFWLGMPWDKKQPDWTFAEWRVVWTGVICFILGIVTNLSVLFAAAWAQTFWAIAHAGLHVDPSRRLQRLLPLAVLAFPWISLDCEFIGFWFRLSGAQVAESFLKWQGVAVQRIGTLMSIGSVELDVSEACGGLNSLQTMLIGGFALAYIQLSHSKWFWLSVPILVIAAWFANTLRVLLTAYIVVWGEPQWATGQNHEWQGLVVLFACFLACAGIFTCLRGRSETGEADVATDLSSEGPR